MVHGNKNSAACLGQRLNPWGTVELLLVTKWCILRPFVLLVGKGTSPLAPSFWPCAVDSIGILPALNADNLSL